MILIPQKCKTCRWYKPLSIWCTRTFRDQPFCADFSIYPFTLLWIGYLIHKNNIVSPWNLYHLHNTTNYILLFIKRSLFSDRLFYYFALYPSFDLERVPSIYLFVQFSSLLIHTKSSIYNSVLVKEREITFAKCIINGMLYLQDGIERQCNEMENKYLLHIRDSVGIPGH